MNRRGNAFQNLIIIIVFIGVLALFLPIAFKIVTDLDTSLQSTEGIPTEFKDSSSNFQGRFTTIWDGLFLFLLVVGYVGLFITAFSSDSKPVLFLFVALGMTLMVFVIPFIANAYASLEAQPEIASSAAAFTIVPFVMTNYLLLSIVMIFTVLIAFFARRTSA